MTKEELAAYIKATPVDQLEQDYAGLNDEERALFDSVVNEAPEPGFFDGTGQALMQIIPRTLNVPGGLTRAAIFGVGDIGRRLGGEEPVVTMDDLKNAYYGEGPSMREYLKRSGYPEGITLGELQDLIPESTDRDGMLMSIGKALGRTGLATAGVLGQLAGLGRDTSARDVVGTVGDLYTDPINKATLATAPERQIALKEAQEFTPLLSSRTLVAPTENLRQRLGKGIYNNSFARADRVGQLAGKGENALANTAFKYGKNADYEELAKLADDLVETQQDIIQNAARKGARVDVKKVFKPVIARAKKIQSSASLDSVKAQAKALEDQAQKLSDEFGYRPEQKIVTGRGEQTSLLRPKEIAQPVEYTQQAFNYDLPIPAKPSLAQGELFPVPQSVGGQMRLIDDAASASTQLPSPSVYEELLTKGVIPKEQTEMFTPGQLTQPAKTTIIPEYLGAPVDQVQSLKSEIQNAAFGEGAYNELAKQSAGGRLLNQAGRRARIAVEKAVDAVDPGQGKRLAEINQDIGNFLTSQKVLAQQAARDAAKNTITEMDPLFFAAGPGTFAAKKGIKLLNVPRNTSAIGKAIALDPGYTDILLREFFKPQATKKDDNQ